MNVSELISERDRLLQHMHYSANPSRDRTNVSFDDKIHLDTLQQPGRKRKLNFLSFDASTMMRPSQ